MFTIFSCSINVTVTSQNGVPSFHLHQRAYMCMGLFTKNNLIFMFVAFMFVAFMFVAFKWLITSKEPVKIKFDSMWTSILREIDVDLTSMCWEKHIAYKKRNSGNLRVPCD